MTFGQQASAEQVTQAAARAVEENLPQVTAVLRDSAERALTPEEQTVVARHQFAELALALPMASIGTCSQDGTDLQFEEHGGEMLMCCAHGHCWKTGWTPV